jgi:hypothetical protein
MSLMFKCMLAAGGVRILVLEASDTMDNDLGGLTTIEVARDLSVGLLTLVTTS